MKIFSPTISGSSQASGSLTISGSLNVSQGITGSLFGTASWAINVVNGGGGGSTDTGSLLTTASVNLNTITFTKGDGSTFPITVNTGSGGGGGSVGTLAQVTALGASTTVPITASIISANGFTGSLLGTSSWATNTLTASFLPVGTYNITSSWAQSASNAINARTASFVNNLNQNLSITGAVILSGSALPELRVIGETQFTGSVGSTSGFTGSLLGTSSWATNALTASFANTLNQNLIITGTVSIGTSSIGPNENTLTLGARDTVNEGGQLGLNAPGGTYTSASFIDLYQNRFRVLRGTNASSDAEYFNINLHTGQVGFNKYTGSGAFPGTANGYLAVDTAGNIVTATGTGGSTTPGGSNTQIQYNNSNAFGGVPTLTYDGTTLRATGSFTGSLTGSIFGTASWALNVVGGGGGVTINNNVDNYLITATGTANTLNGESGLTFDGTTLTVANNAVITAIDVRNDPSTTIGQYAPGAHMGRDWPAAGGPALTAGNIVYFSGSSQWVNAQANATGSSTRVLGVVTDAADPNEILLQGTITINTDLASYSVGQPVYLSPISGGRVTNIPPSSSGHVARYVGWVVDTSRDQIYFNPDFTYIQL
jgi:hypothetical protein